LTLEKRRGQSNDSAETRGPPRTPEQRLGRLEPEERLVRIEPEHDLPRGLEARGTDEGVQRDHMNVAEISLKRGFVADGGGAGCRVSQVYRSSGCRDGVATRDLALRSFAHGNAFAVERTLGLGLPKAHCEVSLKV